MKKYDLYKDSGFEWIGEIPNHWKVIRLKHKGEVIIGLSYNPDNVVDEEYGTLVLRSSNIQNGKISLNDNVYVDSLISEKLRTRKGDILICSRNGSRNLIGKNCLITPEVEGKTWGVFMSLYRSKNPYFLYWILNSPIFESQSGLYLTSTINQLTVSTLENLVVPFTEDELEQHQIVKYLDEKTTIIDTLIEKTQQKIDTLKELRSSLINKVVTKGLDPNVEMKDSGVEWIGEIPKHWRTIKLKYQGEVIIGLSYSPENQVEENDGVLVMRSSNVQDGKPSFKDNVYVNCKIPDKLITRTGDILICSRNGSRRLIGKNCLITSDIEGMSWGVFMTVYRSPSYKFFYWLLNSPVFESQSSLFLTSTINQLTVSTLENMLVPFVDDIMEQEKIVIYLDEQTQLIDTSIQKEELRIEKLKEYRQSLISDVVTGKIKVTDYE